MVHSLGNYLHRGLNQEKSAWQTEVSHLPQLKSSTLQYNIHKHYLILTVLAKVYLVVRLLPLVLRGGCIVTAMHDILCFMCFMLDGASCTQAAASALPAVKLCE